MSGLSAYSKQSLVTWPQHIDYGSHRWKSTFQHFAKIPKFQKFVLIFTVPKTWDTLISKNISDLKDIKFEISTALQFEPSQ